MFWHSQSGLPHKKQIYKYSVSYEQKSEWCTHKPLGEGDRRIYSHKEKQRSRYAGDKRARREREKSKPTVWQNTNEHRDRETGRHRSWQEHKQALVEVRWSQSQVFTNTNDYKLRRTDREAGRQVIMWVRHRHSGRQVVMSACFCSPQEAAQQVWGPGRCLCDHAVSPPHTLMCVWIGVKAQISRTPQETFTFCAPDLAKWRLKPLSRRWMTQYFYTIMNSANDHLRKHCWKLNQQLSITASTKLNVIYYQATVKACLIHCKFFMLLMLQSTGQQFTPLP